MELDLCTELLSADETLSLVLLILIQWVWSDVRTEVLEDGPDEGDSWG